MTSPAAVTELLRTTASRESGYVDETPDTLRARVILQEPDELDRWRGVRQYPTDAWLTSCDLKDGEDGEYDAELDGVIPTHNAPFRMTVYLTKLHVAGELRFYTAKGFADSLIIHRLVDKFRDIARVRLVGIESTINTLAFSIVPWDAHAENSSQTHTRTTPGDARMTVRTNDARLVPCSIAAWLPIDRPSRIGPTAEALIRDAVEQAASGLASEIWRQDGSVEHVLRGPLTRKANKSETSIRDEQAWSVLEAARWVYELGPETEVRHSLLVQELARMWPAGAGWQEGLALKVGDALEIARVAYSLHLGEASAESLRSLAELRKALADETTKIAGFSRDLTISLWRSFVVAAGAIITNVLVVQKEDTPDLRWLGWPTAALIVMAYIFETITQRYAIGQLRKSLDDWRSRIFPYISDDDFESLGRKPLRRANFAYWVVWVLVLTLNLVLAIVLIMIATGHLLESPTFPDSSFDTGTENVAMYSLNLLNHINL